MYLLRDFKSSDASVFASLNLQWINETFTLESQDKAQLTDPTNNIINAGGHIVIAEIKGLVVGTGALLPVKPPVPDHRKWMELIKMTTAPLFRGHGIGKAVLLSLLKKAENNNIQAIWLETNSKLTRAVKLYENNGFTPIKPDKFWPSLYSRCDRQLVYFF